MTATQGAIAFVLVGLIVTLISSLPRGDKMTPTQGSIVIILLGFIVGFISMAVFRR